MYKEKFKFWICLTMVNVLLPSLALAQLPQQQETFGDVAANLFIGALAIQQIVKAICIITGICLILSSGLQYKKYRQNPTEVRIGTPIITFIIGLAVLALAFIPLQIFK